jgi:hypothetical protein
MVNNPAMISSLHSHFRRACLELVKRRQETKDERGIDSSNPIKQIITYNQTLSIIAMRVNNPDCSLIAIQG